jgi:hypothetical protein
VFGWEFPFREMLEQLVRSQLLRDRVLAGKPTMQVNLLASHAAEGEQVRIPVDFGRKFLFADRAGQTADHGRPPDSWANNKNARSDS